MPTSTTGRTEAGVTLVELLVVLLIIGLSVSFVVFSVPRGQSDLAKATTLVEREIAGLRDSAVSNVAIFGLTIDGRRLDRFRAGEGEWLLAQQTELPGRVVVKVQSEEGWSLPEHEEEISLGGVFEQQEREGEGAFRPAIVFSPEGGVTPFSVTLRDRSDSVTIRVGPFGRMQVEADG
ncbi:MAG: prepilin-type N-terminal cleavage/methylation domain-containing protein [Parvularculaceae bacterium]|nr:prepilin-type N-terminal cleavage/methylation domain-containing protein [Parvularculaceae bacterium]